MVDRAEDRMDAGAGEGHSWPQFRRMRDGRHVYRIESPDDAAELGLDEAFARAIVLVEWPDRLPGPLPANRLEVAFDYGTDEDGRTVRLVGHGAWSERLAGIAA